MSDLEVDYMKLVCLTALLKATGTHEESWRMLMEAHQDLNSRAPADVRERMNEIFDNILQTLLSHRAKEYPTRGE